MKDIVVTVASSELALDEAPASTTVSVVNRTPVLERIVLTAVVARFVPASAPTGAAGAARVAGATGGPVATPAGPLEGEVGPEITIDNALRDVGGGATVQYAVTFGASQASPGRYDVKFIASPSEEATEEYAERAGRLVVAVAQKDPKPPRRPWKLIAAVVALLVAVAGVAFVLTRPGSVTVPDVVDQAQAQAEQRLTAAGLVPVVTTTPGAKPLGVVISQHPAAETEVMEDTKVTVVVKTSLELVDVTPLNVEAAQAQLQALGFSNVTTSAQESSEPMGKVLNQVPSPGTPAALDDQITLTFASVFVDVPDVIGRNMADAIKVLNDRDLSATVATKACNITRCTVREQRPPSGESVPFGTAIELIGGISRPTIG